MSRIVNDLFLGLDLGSVSVNFVLLDEEGRVKEERYLRHRGRPVQVVAQLLKELQLRGDLSRIGGIGVTGSGGSLVAPALSALYVNEVVAHCRAAARFQPQVRTIIEMGGEDSKLICLELDGSRGVRLVDFAMNSICAAGTGSFLDQQANRLGVSIEGEFGELALKSKNPPRIAGRCSVFAKSDMIHLQQVATPEHDILAALCHAVARNFKSCIAKGKPIHRPIAFLGGVAANRGMVRAFEEVFGLGPGELLIPPYHASMGAIGAALIAAETISASPLPIQWERVLSSLERAGEEAYPAYDPLPAPIADGLEPPSIWRISSTLEKPIPAYLGVDVGSISTNLVLLDQEGHLLARRYLMTAGRPIEAVRQGLAEIGQEIGDRVIVVGAATTGSGRYMIGDFIGADLVKNEITAQARAAVQIDPSVDTIFEIGGQDSKFISLQDGVVVDFEMNKVCAAGTGSFLEEQAEKLSLRIEEEFSKVALSASRPARLGERCTVFMESDLTNLLQKGVKREDLVAGLSYSIVQNYLTKVVGDRRVGNRIFFQGGVAANQAVVAAFRKVTKKPIFVPSHHDVTGAIGAALLARDAGIRTSRFKGFELARRPYLLESFPCHACPNQCEINRVQVEGEPPLFYGSRCERYERGRGAKSEPKWPDLFSERESALLSPYPSSPPAEASSSRIIGFPRVLLAFYDLYPFWKAFFGELGIHLVLSDPTHRDIIHHAVEEVAAETCFPVKVAHGHVLNLLHKGVRYMFLPSIIDLPGWDPRMERTYTCPYVQTIPYLIQSSLELKERGIEVLAPSLYLRQGRESLRSSLCRMQRDLDCSQAELDRALEAAYSCWEGFLSRNRQRGEEVLGSLGGGEIALVVLSRSYNGHDRLINLDLPSKLRDLGVLALPMDFLPAGNYRPSREYPQMYWYYGQRILAAADLIARDPRLFAVHITNFACGPDSFISHFFKEKMGGKPFLQLEIDEHSADAGIITRCEAFLDSIQNARWRRSLLLSISRHPSASRDISSCIVYIPYMSDHAFALQAAFTNLGVRSEVLPETDVEAVNLARKYTSGRECFPCIVTLGDILKKAQEEGFDPARSIFFMPSANGPCRFGQYATFQKKVLQELGLNQVGFLSPDSKDSYSFLGTSFRRNAWKGVVAVDLLEKMSREVRPYEANPGDADRTFRESLDRVCYLISRGQDPMPALKEAKEAFSRIPRRTSRTNPVVGVVGEIFLRAHRFSNNHLVRRLEELGGEVWVAPMTEWIFYTNALYKKHACQQRQWWGFFWMWLQDLVQKWDEHRLSSAFRGALENLKEPSTEDLLRWASPYLNPSYEGEAILSLGKAVDYVRRGVSGLIAVMPFTCMPGTIVNAISKRLRQELGPVPFLSLSYDGLDEFHAQTRLEAFMYQVRECTTKGRK